MAKVQLGVIFGSRSCEREVSIISAVQLMNHVDSEKYDVIPVYIGENGVWYTGNALRRIETYTPFDPNKAGIEAVALDVTAGSGALLANRLARCHQQHSAAPRRKGFQRTEQNADILLRLMLEFFLKLLPV